MLLNFFSLAPTMRLNKLECWLMMTKSFKIWHQLSMLLNFFSLPLTPSLNKLECLLMGSFLKTAQYWLLRQSVLGLAYWQIWLKLSLVRQTVKLIFTHCQSWWQKVFKIWQQLLNFFLHNQHCGRISLSVCLLQVFSR